ncbi:hypothetical protein B0T24DRAFT_183036 [Lasiosphaeria ovina]|uniref:Uncharacterized protein n=1 Tax=Lasiosphaeria ovina TaxID=92902 RepID=A0AAE0TU92_9PEZI|nr:hypothetical protein B0T24DRAFT_183036 [Lasiosphaeria ovina]
MKLLVYLRFGFSPPSVSASSASLGEDPLTQHWPVRRDIVRLFSILRRRARRKILVGRDRPRQLMPCAQERAVHLCSACLRPWLAGH